MNLPTPRNLLNRLTPLPGKSFNESYSDSVRRLCRPYYNLTKEMCVEVEKLVGDSDVLLFDGKVQVTWGTADCGYCLMHLNQPI